MEVLEGLQTQVSIFDASGRLLLEQAVLPLDNADVRIDLNSVPDGILLVRVVNSLGIFSKMLLKTEIGK